MMMTEESEMFSRGSRRSRIDIIADILSSARDCGGYDEGANITSLLRKANMPHNRIVGILSSLVESGLLTCRRDGKSARYSISGSGVEFLKAYGSLLDLFNDAMEAKIEIQMHAVARKTLVPKRY